MVVCYLAGRFGSAAVVVVGGEVGILMHTVQEPEQKLQSVVLSVSFELRAILGHSTLGKGWEIVSDKC